MIINLLSASALWEALSSWYAIAVYAIVIIVIMISVIISVMRYSSKDEKIEISDEEIAKSASNVETAEQTSDDAGKKSDAESGRKRFEKLSAIDNEAEKYQRDDYDENISLKSFCDRFRAYAASRLNLYYDIADIRKFIAGMSVSKVLILQGMSGTGKTSLAYAFGSFVENNSVVVPIQPMWKERTDLIGYYNEFTKQYNETTLLTAMYEAGYSKDIYITILDEMNIARVEYYFAEFLSLLEIPDGGERMLDVIGGTEEDDPKKLVRGKIQLPSNMWFIGTANKDDSTFAISDKVYDRAMVLNLDKKAEPIMAPYTENVHLSAERFEELGRQAQKEYGITRRNSNRLEQLDKYMIDNYHVTFGNRIMKQIRTYVPVYVACGGNELEALDDILAKKVMRKLESQSPTYIRSHKEDFNAMLDGLFGEDSMPDCRAAMERIAGNA